MPREDADKEWIESELRRLDERFHTFMATVTDRFSQVNEFRGALDDLSKDMATRRELEAAISNIKGETAVALASANAKTDQQASELATLRSRLDVGNPEVRLLQSRADRDTGETNRTKEIIAYAFAVVTVAVSLTGIIAILFNH